MTQDDEPQLKSGGAELAQRLHDTLSGIGEGAAKVGSVLLTMVPGGATVLETISMGERHDIRQRVDMLMAALERTPEVEQARVVEALDTPGGRQHVRTIVERAARTDDAEHMRALANAFVSGLGLQALAPSRVTVLDDTLRAMTAGHVAVLRHAAERQRGMSLEARFSPTGSVKVREVAPALAIEAGLAQKLAIDLMHLGVAVDPSFNFIASHWGLQSFALTSFGLDLVRYIEDPSAYHQAMPPPMESPAPPTAVPPK